MRVVVRMTLILQRDCIDQILGVCIGDLRIAIGGDTAFSLDWVGRRMLVDTRHFSSKKRPEEEGEYWNCWLMFLKRFATPLIARCTARLRST